MYNSFNWQRTDPVLLKLPKGSRPAGMVCQADSDGRTLCKVDLAPASARGLEMESKPA